MKKNGPYSKQNLKLIRWEVKVLKITLREKYRKKKQIIKEDEENVNLLKKS